MPDERGADSLQQVVDRVRRHFDDGCFACGRENPIGLHLDGFSETSGTVRASFTPRPEYRGFVGSLHGGIAATALDEILAWAGIITNGVVSVTGRLELRYREPLTTDRPLVARGRIEAAKGRRLTMSGELLSGETTAVTAKGLYIVTAAVADLLAGHTTGD